MDYKIAKLTLKNFKGSTKLEVRFDNKVNYLIGVNGSGKTMIGTALQYLFSGKTFFNNKYRRRIITDDSDKMKVSGEFVNNETGKSFIISQSLTAKDNPNLKIESGVGTSITIKEVMGMIDMLYLRPFDIVNKTPQEQAKLIGVDTTKHDEIIKKKKSNLTLPRASVTLNKNKLKAYDEEPEKVDSVDIADLYEKKDDIDEFNKTEIKKKDAIDEKNKQIQELKTKLFTAETDLKGLAVAKALKSLDDIAEQLSNAAETNRKATAYTDYTKIKSDLEIAEKDFNEKESEVTKAEEEKITYVKNSNVPESISFDDDGGLMITAFGQKNAYLNEDFFSRGQILKMSVQFCLTKIVKDRADNKPTISVMFIDNAESLDKDKLEYLDKVSLKYGIQFILAYQDDKTKDGKTCIMLSEKSIEKYKEG